MNQVKEFGEAGAKQWRRVVVGQDALLEGLASTPPAPGEERVVYAGLLEAEDTKIRLAEGIPYHTEVIEWFRRVEAEMKLDFDFT